GAEAPSARRRPGHPRLALPQPKPRLVCPDNAGHDEFHCRRHRDCRSRRRAFKEGIDELVDVQKGINNDIRIKKPLHRSFASSTIEFVALGGRPAKLLHILEKPDTPVHLFDHDLFLKLSTMANSSPSRKSIFSTSLGEPYSQAVAPF
ncbi:hypothetical protein, partial [Bradyrhizobium sp.]|uniref:hypothetical protein n=1 Tax=Bradyrhizobium sp. TaxID=376 RepID=UPI003C1C1A61